MSEQKTILYRYVKEEDFPILRGYYVQLDEYFRSLGMNMPDPEDEGQAWLDSFQRMLGKFAVVHIAEMDGEVVGFMLGRLKRVPQYWGGVMVGLLSDMYVDKKARRRGVAGELSRLTIEWLRARDVHSVELQIMHKNDAALKLFMDMGFEIELKNVRMLADAPINVTPPENAEYDLD